MIFRIELVRRGETAITLYCDDYEKVLTLIQDIMTFDESWIEARIYLQKADAIVWKMTSETKTWEYVP